MKGLTTLALLLTAVLLFGQTSKLNLASDVWPPFTDVDSKHAFAIDLVREALARNKVQAKTDILEFRTVMEDIRSGKFDGSAALWHSAERAEYLLYSEPYLENRLILVAKKGTDVSAASLSELKGKRIAVVKTYAYGPLLEASNAELVAGSSDQQNLERLLKGEADYMLADALLIEYLLKYQREEAVAHLEIGTTALLKLPLYFAIRKEIPDAAKIIDDFNKEIKEMIAEGLYNRILRLNWIATDVDGDGNQELVLNGNQAGTQAPMNSYRVITPQGETPQAPSRYLIEGSYYDNWEHVPEKYKVPQASVSDAEKRGFGPVLNF